MEIFAGLLLVVLWIIVMYNSFKNNLIGIVCCVIVYSFAGATAAILAVKFLEAYFK